MEERIRKQLPSLALLLADSWVQLDVLCLLWAVDVCGKQGIDYVRRSVAADMDRLANLSLLDTSEAHAIKVPPLFRYHLVSLTCLRHLTVSDTDFGAVRFSS